MHQVTSLLASLWKDVICRKISSVSRFLMAPHHFKSQISPALRSIEDLAITLGFKQKFSKIQKA